MQKNSTSFIVIMIIDQSPYFMQIYGLTLPYKRLWNAVICGLYTNQNQTRLLKVYTIYKMFWQGFSA
jgi:hypothetical protein